MTIPAGYRGNQWGFFYKESDNSGPYYLDADGQMVQGLPSKFYTDENGPYARLRVDVGQTAFFAGRTFKSFQKLSISDGTTITIRATVPIDVIVSDVSVSTENATVEVQRMTGGTAAGPWTAMPVFPMNTMSTAVPTANQVTLDYDGAHSGGTTTDLVRIVANNKSSAISAAVSERGVGAGVYYYVISNVGNQTATVVFSAIWEERP